MITISELPQPSEVFAIVNCATHRGIIDTTHPVGRELLTGSPGAGFIQRPSSHSTEDIQSVSIASIGSFCPGVISIAQETFW